MLIVVLIWWAGDFPELRRIQGRYFKVLCSGSMCNND
jgi:hypothetical protein